MREAEKEWLRVFDKLVEEHTVESLALLHHTHCAKTGDLAYSDETTPEFKEAYHERLRISHDLPSDPVSLGDIFDVYMVFREMGYKVSCTQRENYYEGLAYEEDTRKSPIGMTGKASIDIFCEKEKTGLSIHIDSSGRWNFSEYGSHFRIAKEKIFTSLEDLHRQISITFHFLMDVELNLTEMVKKLDDEEVFYKEYLEGKAMTEAEIIREEERRAQDIQGKALARVAAFLEGKDDPYPDLDD